MSAWVHSEQFFGAQSVGFPNWQTVFQFKLQDASNPICEYAPQWIKSPNLSDCHFLTAEGGAQTAWPVPDASPPGSDEKYGQLPPSPVGVGGGGGDTKDVPAKIRMSNITGLEDVVPNT
jgi:hypothetical protein